MTMVRRNSRRKKGKKGRIKPRETIRVTQLPYIPHNILEEIFHKLPYNAITICKIVCKTWNSIISSPNFINDHYNRLRVQGNTHLIFLEFNKINYKHNFSTLSHSDIVDNRSSSSISNTVTSLVGRIRKKYRDCQTGIIGSYNGLVALSFYDRLILWNPITDEQISVIANYYNIDIDYSDHHFSPRLLHGLCYDYTKDEYSVVLGSDYQSPPVSPTSFNKEVECESIRVFHYNFKDGSRKEFYHRPSLKRRLLDRKLFKGEVGKVIRGVPHWVVQFYDWVDPFVKTEILYFDLGEEVFKEMDRPSGCVEKKLLGLAAMKGEIELGCVLEDVDSSCFEIWVMKEYGNIESWTNLYTISYINLSDNFGCIKYLDVMGFRPNNGELLIYLNNRVLLVYNVYGDIFREFKLEGVKFVFVTMFEPKLTSPPTPLVILDDETEDETEENEEDENDDDDDFSYSDKALTFDFFLKKKK